MLLVVLPGYNNFGFHPVNDDAEHVQRAIQLAHVRELIGSDSIRVTASSLRKVNQVNEFVVTWLSCPPLNKDQALSLPLGAGQSVPVGTDDCGVTSGSFCSTCSVL